MNTPRFLTLRGLGTLGQLTQLTQITQITQLTQLGLLAAAPSVFAEPSLTIYSQNFAVSN